MFDFLKRWFGDKPKKDTPNQLESTVDESEDPDLDPEVIFILLLSISVGNNPLANHNFLPTDNYQRIFIKL